MSHSGLSSRVTTDQFFLDTVDTDLACGSMQIVTVSHASSFLVELQQNLLHMNLNFL